MVPARAVPAAANYLARLERKFGGRDWAVWAYHCGEGCTTAVQSIAERADGIGSPMTVPKVFFGAHPARNLELHESLRNHMERDYSPTYWFRIMRAEQLLGLYAKDKPAFRRLFQQYRNHVDPQKRAPHRLAVWLKPDDLTYLTCEDLRREHGKSLVPVFDDPQFYGFSLRTKGAGAIGSHDLANREYYLQASPAVVGTIAYIAYETRRLHAAMKPRGERFVPLEITALVQPRDFEVRNGGPGGEAPTHCSGQVFDIDYGSLSAGQREALEFVLNDLGWDGYLGFVRDNQSSGLVYHIGASPTARDFFTRVYEDARASSRTSS
jgi:hypothetical protein